MWRKEVRETLKLGGPVILAQLAQTSMTFVDTVMVGRLGKEQLAAVAVGTSFYFPVTLTVLGFLLATGPMVAQAYGARKPIAIGRSLRQGLWLAILLAVPSFLLIRNAAPILLVIGQPPDTVILAQGYLDAISWGVLPLLLFGALRAFAEAVSRPRVVTLIAFGGVVLNILANWVLMYGKLGFPPLGVRGCGFASAIVFWAMMSALLLYAYRQSDFREYQLFARLGTPDPEYFREMVRVGWPIAVALGIEVFFFAASLFLMGLWGVVALSAHMIAIQCASLAFMVPLGVGIAASVRVGQAVGRGDHDGVERAGRVAIALGAGFMTISALAFWIFPHSIVSLFIPASQSADQDVVSLAVTLVAIAGVFQIFDGVQVAAMGALRGLKDTRRPMLIAFLSYWVIGLGTAGFLSLTLGWDGPGIWWGMVAGLATSAVLLVLRWRQQMRDAGALAQSSV